MLNKLAGGQWLSVGGAAIERALLWVGATLGLAPRAGASAGQDQSRENCGQGDHRFFASLLAATDQPEPEQHQPAGACVCGGDLLFYRLQLPRLPLQPLVGHFRLSLF